MSRPTRKEFYLFRRKCKTGTFWYVKFVDPNTAEIKTAKSIDVLKEQLGIGYGRPVKSRDSAALIASKALANGLIFTTQSSVRFIDYCRTFWDFDTSPFVRTRNMMKPNSLGREYCNNMLTNFNRHVAPYFTNSLRIQSLTTHQLDTLIRRHLAESHLSNGTIQLVILSFKEPLKEALREGIITRNPADNIIKVTRISKVRGILTAQEVHVFGHKAKALYESGELFPSYYLAMMLALSTGMRSGEVRALRSSSISTTSLSTRSGGRLSRITVKESLAPYSGVKCPKGKYDRELFIPTTFADQLLSNANPANGIVFPSKSGGYIAAATLRQSFLSVLEQIGISPEEQRDRNLSFHSLRHGFATMSRDLELSQEDRMIVLGHKSEKVHAVYTHVSDSQLKRVSRVTDAILNLFE